MSSPDIAAAARRIALTTRNHELRRGGPAFGHADLVALLPVHEAVAAGQGDKAREERWHAALAGEIDVGRNLARAAIALADAERAAQTAQAPVAWRARTANGLGWAYFTEHEQGVPVGLDWEPLYAGVKGGGGAEWAAYEEARDAFDTATQEYGVEVDTGTRLGEALAKLKGDERRTALDAAVRRFAGLNLPAPP